MNNIVKYSEDDLRNDFIKYLKEEEHEDIGIEINTGYNANMIDCVYVDKRRKFVCVELKLKDTKRVIEQAVKLLIYTPLVYVALPIPKRKATQEKWQNIIKELKLGLYWLNEYGLWQRITTPDEDRYVIRKDIVFFNEKYIKRSFYQQMHVTFLNKCVEYEVGKMKAIDINTLNK